MSIDMEEQYDKIYRYCYFRLQDRQTAEDITQETFLRYLEKYQAGTTEQTLKCLYTIAKNLCVDEYRRRSRKQLCGTQGISGDEHLLTNLAVRSAVSSLGQEEQELLMLRYVNEVPVQTLAQLLGISRFAVHRRLTAVTKKFEEALKKEGIE